MNITLKYVQKTRKKTSETNTRTSSIHFRLKISSFLLNLHWRFYIYNHVQHTWTWWWCACVSEWVSDIMRHGYWWLKCYTTQAKRLRMLVWLLVYLRMCEWMSAVPYVCVSVSVYYAALLIVKTPRSTHRKNDLLKTSFIDRKIEITKTP